MGRAAVVTGIVIALAGNSACGRYGFERTTTDAASNDVLGSDVLGVADSRDPCAGFDICDGFEAATLDSTLWSTDPMVTRDTTVAHRGAASVHFHIPALAMSQGNYETLWETKTLTTAPVMFWIRGWFRLGALPAGTNGMELMSIDQVTGPGDGDYVFVHSTDTMLYDQFDNSTMQTTPPPTNTWFCVVWKVVRENGAGGSLELTSDVIPTITITGSPTDSSPPVVIVVFGIGFAGNNVDVPQPSMDLWVDDVIVNTSPVTCAD